MDATILRRTQKGDGIGRHSAQRKNSLKTSASFFRAKTPWGWKGSSMGDGWGLGAATPHQLINREVSGGWPQGCRRDWRGACHAGVPDEREVGEAGTVTGSPFSWAQSAVVYHLIGPSDGSVG